MKTALITGGTGFIGRHLCADLRSDGWAVTVHCLTSDTVRGVEVRRFDGVHWEQFIAGSGIRAFSKQD